VGDLRLGRWQALDKGEVRPTPAFRLLRVGANSYVIESLNIALSGKYCILEYAYPVWGSPLSFTTFPHYLHQVTEITRLAMFVKLERV
jgi:hypothetical protein